MSEGVCDFDANDVRRSLFLRELIIRQIDIGINPDRSVCPPTGLIPKRLVRYWHDEIELPTDVRACLDSWETLTAHGFEIELFNDITAASYISQNYGSRETTAFARCVHPAMRSDYFRLCFILREGGFYVDADDVLVGDGWIKLFETAKLKVQPLCYDISASKMVQSSEVWNRELSTDGRIFYVNNDPLVAPPGHPIISRALSSGTAKLLANSNPEIQATTGPGNLTAALASHALQLDRSRKTLDFELIMDWDSIAEMRWDLSYRNDDRNWRNVYGC